MDKDSVRICPKHCVEAVIVTPLYLAVCQVFGEEFKW